MPIVDSQDIVADEWPRITDRSILYNLEPIGIGTPQVEGLRSYMVRLARSHGITVRHLVRRVMADADPAIGSIGNSAFFRRDAATLNGLGSHAGRFVGALEALTTRKGLRMLTLLPWRDLLPRNGAGLLARLPQWCPACLRQAASDGREVHHPLVWSLAMNAVCRQHCTQLWDKCPKCSKSQPFLPRLPTLLRCAHCWAFLSAEDEAGHEKVPSKSTSLWVSGALGDIASGRLMPAAVDARALFMKRLSALIDDHSEGNRAAFCRMMRLKPQALKNWYARGERPSLPQFLAICFAIDRAPSELFAGVSGVCEVRPVPLDLTPQRAPRPMMKSAELGRLKAALEEGRQAHQTVNAVSRAMQVKRSTLKYWLPDECSETSAVASANRLGRAAISNERRESAVRSAIASLADEGAYPSRRRIEEVLRRSQVSLLDPLARRTYRDERRKLVARKSKTSA